MTSSPLLAEVIGFNLQVVLPMSSRVYPLVRRLANYVCATAAYGFVRSATYDYDGAKRYFNKQTLDFEVKERLLIHKFGGVMAGTLAAITVWPFLLAGDLARLECAVRGKDPREYQ
jgi:hypothetical protein